MRPHDKKKGREFLAAWLALKAATNEPQVINYSALGRRFGLRKSQAARWIHAIENGTFDVDRREAEVKIRRLGPKLPKYNNTNP